MQFDDKAIVELLTFGMISDITSATVLNAAPLVIAIFIFTALASKQILTAISNVLYRDHGDLEASHQLVDILWVFASIIALSLVGWSMAVEPANKIAEGWRHQILQRQSITRAAAYEEYGHACSNNTPEILHKDPELHRYCGTIEDVLRVNIQLQKTLETPDFHTDMIRFPPNTSDPIISVIRFPAWISIKEYINWTNREVDLYNSTRGEAKGARTLQIVRALWMWLYPFLGGLRVQRSFEGLRARINRSKPQQ